MPRERTPAPGAGRPRADAFQGRDEGVFVADAVGEVDEATAPVRLLRAVFLGHTRLIETRPRRP